MMRKYRYRSAITGLFVTLWYALRHPKTTVAERLTNKKTK
jgi:hypothetical protein